MDMKRKAYSSSLRNVVIFLSTCNAESMCHAHNRRDANAGGAGQQRKRHLELKQITKRKRVL